MSASKMRTVETRFMRRATSGLGIGLNEAVESAERRIEVLGDAAREEIAAMLSGLQQHRRGVAARDATALAQVWAQADSLAGVAGVFGMPQIGHAAKSLCQLFDAAQPAQPTADALRVHLDALRVLQGLGSGAMTEVAPPVLAGLDDVVAAERRRKASPSRII